MNLNKVYLIGRLASDPEFRTTPSGQEVASLRMVTNRIWNDQSGQRKESSEFHNVVVWGRLAQIANQYLNKGSMLMIEGRLQTRNWEGQDGVKRYKTEIVAESLQLGPKPRRAAEGELSPRGEATVRQGREGMQDQGAKMIKPASAEGRSAELSRSPTAGKEEIPIVNENEPPSDSEVEEDEVQLKDVPF
ncbi:MAG: single-strand DNA-binding protein [Parcubacteria group bacterium Gr01-1014_2]|nr:MAG: single-strand DNA-binding protein [Parcubacteria group bacterium Gr01-1014_2]